MFENVIQLSNFICIFAMERKIYKTPAFEEFYNTLNTRVKKKVDYIFEYMRTEKYISAKFVKHLTNTDFYEMRISVDNEYRVILFTIDHDNFIEAVEIVLLNGFIKKSTTDYGRQILIASKIMEEFL